MENLSSTSCTYQIFRYSIICTSLTTWIPRMAGPSPSKQCWNEETLLGPGKVYSPAQTTTLFGGWGRRGEIKADHVNCPKSFVPHCRLKMGIRVTEVLTTCLEVIFRVTWLWRWLLHRLLNVSGRQQSFSVLLSHPNDHFQSRFITPGFKTFSYKYTGSAVQYLQTSWT